MNATYAPNAINMPEGHTLDTLSQSIAGRVYIIANMAAETYTRAEDFMLGMQTPEHVETTPNRHIECYARLYSDGSLLVVSNADNEVWDDEADYLSHYDLRRIDTGDGWMYVAATEEEN